MTAKTLRQSVLQRAIQGKLVPQDSSDEPASVLLERIKRERKEKTGKENTNITEKVPYDIPTSWCWIRLSSVGEWHAGATPNRSCPEYYNNGDIPWIKTGDLNDGYIDSAPEYITERALRETSVKTNKAGSVLIAMYGATIGKLGILNIEATTNQACCACFPIDCVYNRYLFYFLLSHRGEFIKQGAGGAQPNISKEKIVATLMPLPPLAEQQRIVEALDKIYPLLDEYEKMEEESSKLDSEICDRLRSSILRYAMQGKLVPQDSSDEPASVLFGEIKEERQKKLGKKHDDTNIFKGADEDFYEKIGNTERNISNGLPFELPAGWEWTRLSSLCEILNGDRGKNYPAKSKLSNEGIPFISALNLDGEKVVVDSNLMCLTEEQFNALRAGKLRKDDIVVCIRGSIGKHARYQFDRGAIASSLVILRPFHKSEALSSFIMSYLDSPFFYTELDKYINGSAQPNLSAKNFGQFLVPLPPLAEQQRIVEAVDKAFAQVDALEAAIKSSNLA